MCESVTYDIEPRQNSIIVEDMPVQKSVKLLSSNKYCNPRSKKFCQMHCKMHIINVRCHVV